ncbi:hypothetical protein BKK81_12485 [Cupriavidus sp. USMAHM13]|uniref:PepSY-associated TM helix domain-containing protein n=1 Tax=Cupriavidus sp. USMAHM13 TaxID=1389192 RepID=UPI0008A70823|nr:PepSY-associated TM helix domain-containing protein [Cupriavidus sp. USMAHM13]AOY99964.1 hypothetical protein BKK81_12485 [Cupriavidus sp. USMAHM13]
MKAATLRLYQTLHTWVGLMAGWALFIAFFAGALTVFHEELHSWQSVHRARHAAAAPAGAPDGASVDRFVQALVASHPAAAASVYVSLPTAGEPELSAYWQEKNGAWQFTTASRLAAGKTSPAETSLERVRGELANFLNSLHYSLGLSDAGMYLMGAISVLYGLALVSGVLLHLPRLKKDLLAVRPGRNLKRFWMDAHNVLGLFSLPFHLVFAVTGAMFCLSMVLVMAFDTLAFDGKLMPAVPRLTAAAPEVDSAGRPAPLLPAATLLAAARAGGGTAFTPTSIRYQRIGDANAVAEVRGNADGALGSYGSIALHAAAGQPRSGQVMGDQTPAGRDTNHAVYSAMYGLHFGTFGDVALRFVYLVAGLAGAFLFYSGNLLWIESRRKQRQAVQPRVHKLLAQATVGVCLGCCLGVAAAFSGALLWPERPAAQVYFPVFLAALAWSLLRQPARAALDLLYATVAATALIPVCSALVAGDPFWRAAQRGDWAVAGFDIGALAMACGFAALAHATRKRARSGPLDSVWALPPARPDGATGVAATAPPVLPGPPPRH